MVYVDNRVAPGRREDRGRRSKPDADVIVVGAGPTGLMLAAELRLGGVRAVVLERDPRGARPSKANGFNGQILQLLHYRGILDRVEAAGVGPIHPAPRSRSAACIWIPLSWWTPRCGPCRSHSRDSSVSWATGRLNSASTSATDRIRGGQPGQHRRDRGRARPGRPVPDQRQVPGGCDGAHSRVRSLTGISFPGVSYPEVNRLGQFAVHESVTRLVNGDLEVPGLGRVRAGFTRTDRGVFALGSLSSGELMIQTTEDDATRFDDGAALTLAEFQGSIRRVLGADFSLGEATRLSRYQFQARQADRYRDRRTCWPATRLISSRLRASASTSACSTQPILAGSWPRTSWARRRGVCWTPTTVNVMPQAPGRCCKPRLRWRCGAGRIRLQTHFGRFSPR